VEPAQHEAGLLHRPANTHPAEILVAEAKDGYQFVKWTGDVGTIADVNDATTTITMLDHYLSPLTLRLDLNTSPWSPQALKSSSPNGI